MARGNPNQLADGTRGQSALSDNEDPTSNGGRAVAPSSQLEGHPEALASGDDELSKKELEEETQSISQGSVSFRRSAEKAKKAAEGQRENDEGGLGRR